MSRFGKAYRVLELKEQGKFGGWYGILQIDEFTLYVGPVLYVHRLDGQEMACTLRLNDLSGFLHKTQDDALDAFIRL